MRADDDLIAFVGARWPSLLRTLVLLGCPPGEAPDVVTDALSRCRRGWDDVRRNGDVDRLVQDELEAAWSRRRAHLPDPQTSATEDELRELAEEMTILAPPSLDDLRAHDRRRRRAVTRRSVVVLVRRDPR